MPNQRSRRTVHTAVKLFALAALTFPLAMLPPADAVEKSIPHTNKHQSTTKKILHRSGTATKSKMVSAHPRKIRQKSGNPKKVAAQHRPAELKLTRNIQPGEPIATARPVPVPRPTNTVNSGVSQDVKNPPLQIGKTLYQRNGEIRHLDGQ